jgi:hypothetical protein
MWILQNAILCFLLLSFSSCSYSSKKEKSVDEKKAKSFRGYTVKHRK